MRKNIFSISREKTISHDGNGNIEFARVYSRWDAASGIDFVDYAILPPGTSIGFHCHTNNEEIYLILKGTGKMRLDGDAFIVSPGDVIVNRNLSSHGLENQSDEEIHIYVVQAQYRRLAETKKHQKSIGIDIGGTNTKVVLLQNDQIIYFKQIPTPCFQDNREFLDFIQSCVQEINNIDNEPSCIGIGISGFVNANTGCLISSCLIPKIRNVNIKDTLSNKFDMPVHIDNDSNMAAIGETTLGSAKGCTNSITLTLGTGIGAGIIINGSLYRGSSGKAAEIGHFIAQNSGAVCPCGQKGCLNMYTSATALSNTYLKKSGMSKSAVEILELLKLKPPDEAAITAFEEFCDFLSDTIIDLIYLFDPEAIVITGGLSKAGNLLIDRLKSKVNEKIIPEVWRDDCIRLGVLAEKAGAVGAAIQASFERSK